MVEEKTSEELSKAQSEQSSAGPRKSEALSRGLLEIICCPMDKADLVYSKKKNTLTCTRCKFVYPVREGIPILLPPEMQDEKDREASRKNGWKEVAQKA